MADSCRYERNSSRLNPLGLALKNPLTPWGIQSARLERDEGYLGNSTQEWDYVNSNNYDCLFRLVNKFSYTQSRKTLRGFHGAFKRKKKERKRKKEKTVRAWPRTTECFAGNVVLDRSYI